MIQSKLMEARVRLHALPLKKSGKNTFSGYSYFELGDFLPETLKILHDLKVCGVVSYAAEYAHLVLTDTEDGSLVAITSPMAEAHLKGAHPIQNLGAVQTYQRRYLWVTAMEIVENDILDLVHDKKEEPKREVKEPPKEIKDSKTRIEELKAKSKPKGWTIKVEDEGDWTESVIAGTDFLLGFAETPEDVQDIFKVNRSLFDRMKAEATIEYAELMAKFKEVKTKLENK
jgi:hypothetical protein